MHLHEPGAGDVAAVLTDTLEVVRATRRWRVLHAPLGTVPNLARAVFVHPAGPWFYLDLARCATLTWVCSPWTARRGCCPTGGGASDWCPDPGARPAPTPTGSRSSTCSEPFITAEQCVGVIAVVVATRIVEPVAVDDELVTGGWR